MNNNKMIRAVWKLVGPCVLALLSGCTYVKINAEGMTGDIYIDTPYKGRSTIVDEQGPGDADTDTSGDTGGADVDATMTPVAMGDEPVYFEDGEWKPAVIVLDYMDIEGDWM